MTPRRNGHAIIVELIIVTLFFSLSSVVIIQLFAVANLTGKKSAVSTRILMSAQDWADRICAADNTEQLLSENEWVNENGEFTLDMDEGKLVLSGLMEEKGSNGLLFYSKLAGYSKDTFLFSFPVTQYHLKETSQ